MNTSLPSVAQNESWPADGDDSPEARNRRRWPQKIRTGDLLGLPVIDDGNRVFAKVTQVVRTPEGKVRLVTSYGGWFGIGTKAVAVPLEAVAIVGRQVASMDMKPDDYKTAPVWTPARDTRVPDDEIIRIGLTRR